MNINCLREISATLNKEIADRGIVEREYDATRLSYTSRDTISVFRLKGLDGFLLYSNLLTRRKDIVSLLGVRSLEEAYNKVERAQAQPSQLEWVSFDDHFTEVELDLSKLPFIKFYREDGGYYLTSSIYIACFNSICNSSFHRTMYLSRERAVLRIVPRHLNFIISKYFERNRDAPVAMILGVDPLQEIAAATSPGLGVFELSVGAALGGERKVAKTPNYGIPVPANASIVIEGVISQSERAIEGPFTDMLMLLDKAREQPVFIAEHIYASKSTPLLVHSIVPGLWEHQLLMGFPRETSIYIELKRAVPCVKEVKLTEGGFTWLHAVVSVSKECTEGDARLAGIVTVSAHPSVKHVIVVDDDINVEDPLDIEWAVATRTKGGRDVIVLENVRGSSLDPRGVDNIGDKVIVLAIRPRSEPYEKYKRVEIP